LQRLKEEVEREQGQVNSLQNMVVVVDENNENSSDEGNCSQVLCWFLQNFYFIYSR